MARGVRHSRGRSQRGRGGGRGRVRSKGRRTLQSRSTFSSSRLQEIDDQSDASTENSELSNDEETLEEDDASADSDEDEADDIPSKQSYANLLQVLNANKKVNESPPHKKRKLESNVEDGRDEDGTEHREPSNDSSAEPAPEIGDAGLAEAVEEDAASEVQDQDVNADSDDESIILHDPFENHYGRMQESTPPNAITAVEKKQKNSQNSMIENDIRKITVSFNVQTGSGYRLKTVKDFHLKRRLLNNGSRILKKLSAEERDVADEIFSYRDVQYGHRTVDNVQVLRNLASLHALNHVFKTRDRILKNNAKSSQQDEEDSSTNLRDQGFTRPKVLFIVPTKQACAKYVDCISEISEPDQQENKARFHDTFSQEDDDSWSSKPEDFQELFGGNNEEDFRVGLKFTRKTIKYFSGFYNSDVIFSSALGLMRTITTGGGIAKSKDGKKKSHDADFLSSVEVVIVDHAAAIQMQNWQHLDYIFTQLNILPKDSHGCDFSRVRNWYLDGHAKYLRQTILFTGYHTPEINSLFTQHTYNVNGLSRYTPTYTGAMLDIPMSLPYTPAQTFLRIDNNKNIATPDLDSNVRFTYFTTTILPQLVRSSYRSSSKTGLGGTLIMIPSYADFTRLRNFLSTSSTTTSLSFGSISEYTPVRDVARSRSHFISGRHSVLLYTERAHHHFRYRLKGVNKILFYGVPENPVFWSEFLTMLADQANYIDGAAGGDQRGNSGSARVKGAVRALFSKWDAMKLERIVGTERVGRMVTDRSGQGGGDMFEFV